MKANYELLRGRLSDPSWDLPPASQQADATSAEALGRGKRSRNREPLNRSPSVQVVTPFPGPTMLKLHSVKLCWMVRALKADGDGQGLTPFLIAVHTELKWAQFFECSIRNSDKILQQICDTDVVKGQQ